jgi:hypothetical protein
MEAAIPKPKRRPGRPAIGRDPLITLRLPVDLIARIDRWQGEYEGMTRSTALRSLIELGLRTPKAKRAELVDPKDPFGKWTPPKRYTRAEPDPKYGPRRAVRAPQPEPEPVSYTPKRRGVAKPMSKDAIAAAADRAEKGTRP